MDIDNGRIKELELQVEALQREADKYRQATEDCMQQLGWCVGYFAGSHKSRIGGELAMNMGRIRERLHRPQVALPTTEE